MSCCNEICKTSHVVSPARVNVVDEVGGDDSEEETGNRKVQKMQDPKLPKECDIQDHNLTHLPFRSWCCTA